MLTNKDFDRIVAAVATKEDIVDLQGRMQRLEEIQRKTLSGVDRLAKSIGDVVSLNMLP